MPFSTAQIRPATRQDSLCLAALGQQVWLDTYAQDGIRPALATYVHQHFTPARFDLQVSSAQQRLWVAEAHGHLLGYLQLDLAAPCPVAGGGTVEISTLYVLRHAQGQGLGRRLLDAASQHAHGSGQAGLWLSVNATNLAAQAFYARQGFGQLGEIDFELDGVRHPNQVLYRGTQAVQGDRP